MRTVDAFLNSSGNFIWKSRIARALLFNTTAEVSGKISSGGNIVLGKRRRSSCLYFASHVKRALSARAQAPQTLNAASP